MTTALPRPGDEIDGGHVLSVAPFARGNAATLWRLDLSDGRRAVAKAGPGMELEAAMLRHLGAASALPVPAVWHAAPGLMVMEHVEGGGRIGPATERHAAELLAALHGVAAERYGFPYNTTIGPLPQPNPEMEDWPAFYGFRLLHMAGKALAEGRIDAAFLSRVERLAGRLPELLGPCQPPALIHGDVWGGNLLVGRDGRVAAFIDPAIHHADPEVELAFTTLFGTFGETFFRAYGEIRPIRPGFHEVRRPLYLLYPLLVHVRLFGGAYADQAGSILRRFA